MPTGLKTTASCVGFAQYTATITNAGGRLTTAGDGTNAAYALPTTDPSASGPRPLAALLQATTQNVRWRGDGVMPTATVGQVLLAGDAPFLYDGELTKLGFISETAGAILNVHYFV